MILELTETALFGAIDEISPTLVKFRAMGVSVAVDDFGTGFSSFAHLGQLPVDTVKIDKSFTDGLTTELSDSTMVASVVRLAHAFSLKVVAEGVETEKQLVALAALECEFIQGYLVAKPAVPERVPSPEQIEQLMESFKIDYSLPTSGAERYTVLVADDSDVERRKPPTRRFRQMSYGTR